MGGPGVGRLRILRPRRLVGRPRLQYDKVRLCAGVMQVTGSRRRNWKDEATAGEAALRCFAPFSTRSRRVKQRQGTAARTASGSIWGRWQVAVEHRDSAYNESAALSRRWSGDVVRRETGLGRRGAGVDDGSTDRTPQVIHRWMERYPRLHLIQNEAPGKGYSVRNGLLQAVGEVVMFTDADLSAPMEEAERCWPRLRMGGCRIGSRWMDKTRRHHQPLYEGSSGAASTGDPDGDGLPFKDTQCGFKAFKRPVAQVSSAAADRALGIRSGDPVYRAQAGLRHPRVPVTWDTMSAAG